MTVLVIARHGNTFEDDETPRRVGSRTDMPLTEKGREQGRAIGRYLKTHNLIPDIVYASQLKRTQETAKLAIKETGFSNPVFTLDIFNEIDYGPDENKTEAEVIARIGKDAITDWDERTIVPEGWSANPQEIINNWKGFADHILKPDNDEKVLVVTSNGIARFAPHITGDFDLFSNTHGLKIATGSISIFRHIDDKWIVEGWNIKP